MEKLKKKKIQVIVLVAVVCIALIGATYAFFVAQLGSGTNAGVNVTAGTTDSLMFSKGDAISVYATQQNFSETDRQNISDDTYVQADLLAGTDSNPSYDYYVYLDISENTLEYTTDDKQAELVLTVTDKDNNPVSINGLTPVTIEGVTGYDITEATGLIELLKTTISATETVRSVTDRYNITITLINLNSNQNANLDKMFMAEVLIQRDEIKMPLATYIKSLYTEDGTNDLYYHDGSGSYTNAELEAGDNSYRYSGANPNNYVCFGSDASTCPTDNLYRIIGVFKDQVKLIKYDYTTSNLLGTDGDYYGAYLYSTDYYKGSMTTSEIASYFWNNVNYNVANNALGYNNSWSYSQLNTINLNTNYLNNIGTTWANKIATKEWKTAGGTMTNIAYANANTAYKYEMGLLADDGIYPVAEIDKTYGAKMGLMYVSDYGYAAAPSAWTTTLYNYSSVTSTNWLYMGLYESTITRGSGRNDRAFAIYGAGYVTYGYVNTYDGVVRPTFYLKPSVEYSSGDGSAENPIRLIVT